MKMLLFRCKNGHFFRNVSCPYDGWTHHGIRELEAAFQEHEFDSLESLSEMGIEEELLKRVLIVETQRCIPLLEGIAPHSYVIDGTEVESLDCNS